MAEDKMRRSVGILGLFCSSIVAACNLDVPAEQNAETQVVLDVQVQTPDGGPGASRDIGFYAYRGTICGDPRFSGIPLATLRTGSDGRVLTPIYARGNLDACVALLVFGGNSYRDTTVGGLIVSFRTADAAAMDTIKGIIKLTDR
jgi:hypothetical protein